MIKENLEKLSNLFSLQCPLYIVGGFVRDKLLGLNPTDVDLCSKLTLEEVEELLKGSSFKINIKNKALGTATIYNNEISFEYSVFRCEEYREEKAGRHSPSRVHFVDTLQVDATRRDFTINTMYYNLNTNELIDLYDAKNDLNQKLLKMVTPTTLNYDGERILRLIKFASLLSFKIEEQTRASAKANANKVNDLSENVKKKFLNIINGYSLQQKQIAKNYLLDFNLNDLADLVITN